MKKEYTAVGILGLVLFGYALDAAAGPVSISIKSPFAFLEPAVLSRYPFTAVSIAIKTIALFGLILLAFSFVKKKFFLKSVTLLCIAALFELYAIQQLITGGTIIPIQWNLTLAATGIILVLPTIGFALMGFVTAIIDKTVKKENKDLDTTRSVSDNGTR